MFRLLRGKRALLGVFALCALAFTAQKCIENDTLYQDADGDWHIAGEIHNETDMWGTGMMLRGQLLDDDGDVIAETREPICPMELAEDSFNSFDLEFNDSSTLDPDDYRLNVIEGRVDDDDLPDSGLSLEDFTATEGDTNITIRGTVSSTRTYERTLTGCAAFYDASGDVLTGLTLVGFGLTLPLESGEPQSVSIDVPGNRVEPGATHVRLWLAGDSDEPLESDYAAVMSGLIPLD
jgi:hypothetical protein